LLIRIEAFYPHRLQQAVFRVQRAHKHCLTNLVVCLASVKVGRMSVMAAEICRFQSDKSIAVFVLDCLKFESGEETVNSMGIVDKP
jgi:hypothetical protein